MVGTGKIKRYVQTVFKTIKPFKWYMLFYLLYFILCLNEYVNPPAADDPIWNSQAMEGEWNYINQEVYINSFRLSLVIDILIFFLATSNMKNHPLIAKILFLLPFINLLLGIISSVIF